MPGNILISKIRKAIASHKMFEAGDTVACAVSGGPDSVAMLHGLLELKEGFISSLPSPTWTTASGTNQRQRRSLSDGWPNLSACLFIPKRRVLKNGWPDNQ